MQLTERLPDDAVSAAFSSLGIHQGCSVALAVSGGSDSMALLRLAAELLAPGEGRVCAYCVDHGLRNESRAEAQQVAEWCAVLGMPFQMLHWEHPETLIGNLPALAREARYDLLDKVCHRNGHSEILTGHTLDDQAETVLMRLTRGSGVDGLSAMRSQTRLGPASVALKRPLLGFTREELRGHLRALGQDWIEDPTNDDTKYDRVKARQMLEALAPLGLTKQRLADTARMMGLAREALEAQASELSACVFERSPLGFLRLKPEPLGHSPREIALRVLASALNCVSGAAYRPRLKSLEDLLDWVVSNPVEGARSLHGCILRPSAGKIFVLREVNACAPRAQAHAANGTWDSRFAVSASAADQDDTLSVGAVGEAGLAQIPKDYEGLSEGWRNAPRDARLTTPGLWRGDTLLSAPLAPWNADPAGPDLTVDTVWPASC